MASENEEVLLQEFSNKSIDEKKLAVGSGCTFFAIKKPAFNPKLLVVGGGILLLGSAFVIASLYLPPNLTLKFMESMQALSSTFFYMVLGSGIVGAGLGAGLLFAGLREKATLKQSIQFTNEDMDVFYKIASAQKSLSQPIDPDYEKLLNSVNW